jgi:hypothetical protein
MEIYDNSLVLSLHNDSEVYKFHWDWANPINGSAMDIFQSFISDNYDNYADLSDKCFIMYEYNPKILISLIFYIRSFGINGLINSIKSSKPLYINFVFNREKQENKELSYHMMIWLLDNHESVFIKNIKMFVSGIGRFRDCLNMAGIINERTPILDTISEKKRKIDIILKPMVSALLIDRKTVHIFNLQILLKSKITDIDTSKLQCPEISGASLYAPRQNKKYEWLIPNLFRLCNLEMDTLYINIKWREFLKQFANYSKRDLPIETFAINNSKCLPHVIHELSVVNYLNLVVV